MRASGGREVIEKSAFFVLVDLLLDTAPFGAVMRLTEDEVG